MLRCSQPLGCAAAGGVSTRRRPFTTTAAAPRLRQQQHARKVAVSYKETSKDTERPSVQGEDGMDMDEAGLLRLRRHFGEMEPPDQSEGPQMILQRAKAMFRPLPVGLADLGIPSLGVLAALAFGDGMHNANAVYIGLAAGAAARLGQQAFLEQTVPFTLRRHTLLLPVKAELAFGAQSYGQVGVGARGGGLQGGGGGWQPGCCSTYACSLAGCS
jgi:hypothetical protein